MSEFEAIATLTKARISGGIGHNQGDSKFASAEIALEGTLRRFNHVPTLDPLSEKIITDVYINIDFEEDYSGKENWGNEKSDIGTIQFDRNLGDDNVECRTYHLNFSLPFSLYPKLLSMKGQSVKVNIIHELISHPSEDYDIDYLALIKRFHCEINPEEKQPSQQIPRDDAIMKHLKWMWLPPLLVGVYTAFVAMCMWNWFAVRALNVPSITFLQMVGIVWLLKLLINRPNADKADELRWKGLFTVLDACVPEQNKETLAEALQDQKGNIWFDILTLTFGELVGNTATLILGFGLHVVIG
jgi:hypothetical protein